MLALIVVILAVVNMIGPRAHLLNLENKEGLVAHWKEEERLLRKRCCFQSEEVRKR